MTGVYLSQPAERIAATRALLAHYRAFLRSDCTEMRDPEQWGFYYDKPAARRRLTFLVDVAVNRKAGVPDEPGKGARAARRLAAARVDAIRRRGCSNCNARLRWRPGMPLRWRYPINPNVRHHFCEESCARSYFS